MTAVAPAQAGAKARHSATIAEFAASGPSAAGAYLSFQRPGSAGVGYLRGPNGTVGLPGRDPAVGAGLVGWRDRRFPDRAGAA